MPALQAENVGDVVATTLKELGRFKITDLTSSLPKHPAAKRLIKKGKVTVGSGYAMSFNILVGTADESRMVGLNEADDYHMSDQVRSGTVPWRHNNTAMTIEKRLITMNKGAAQIVDLVKVKRASAMADWIKKFETYFWSCPASPADDKSPNGLFYWVTKTGATATFGLNGTLPAGFSDVGGLDPTAAGNDQWRNGNGTYATMNGTDGVLKLWEAIEKSDYEAIIDMQTYYKAENGKGIFTNWNGLSACKQYAISQNDRLGFELDPAGAVTLRRVPIEYVPKLDTDTTNPFYGVDFGTFGTKVLEGWWMKQTGPRDNPVAHNTLVTDWDTSFNWECNDRRKNWVLHQAN